MSAYEEALAATDRGWSIIPVKPNSKEPLGAWKHAQAERADANEVALMFNDGSDANYGVVTGSISGVAVLDIDARSGGIEAAKALFEANGGRPLTPIARTPGGGFHMYFASPPAGVRNSAGKLGPGLDIRGDGGFVVGVGSHREGKQYRWVGGRAPEDVPLAPFPSFLAKFQSEPTPNPTDQGSIPEGRRHHTLTRLAGKLRRDGLEPDAIEAALLRHNQTQCNPPLETGEVASIARSTEDWEKGKVNTPTGFNFLRPSDWLSEPDVATRWVVEDLLPAGSLTMICSPMKAGKSTFARHMAISIAHGTPFLGKGVMQGLVLYLAIEDPPGVVKASFRRLGIAVDSMLRVHYGAVPSDPFTELRKTMAAESPIAVFVDTVGRMRNGRLELNEYAATMEWLEPLLFTAHETGTAIILLYHDNKAGRNTSGYDAMFSILGSVGIAATIDQLIAVRRKGQDDQRSFFTVGRYGDHAETVLAFDPATERLEALGTSDEITVERIKKEILKLLPDEAEEGMARQKVLDEVEGSTKHTVAALAELETAGHITKTGMGKKGAPYLYNRFRSAVLGTVQNGKTELPEMGKGGIRIEI